MKYVIFFLAILYAPIAGAAPETYCEGKYSYAAGLVDAALVKYGTLYSGGLHWHRLDNVGATLDLYRLWNEAPDIGLRKFTPPRYGEKDLPQFYFYPESDNNLGPKVTDVWRGARKGLSLKSKTVTREELIWTAWGMDVLTSLGPSPDWWHSPEQHDNLSPSQKWIAEKSKSEPVLDWLQAVLTASNAPWTQHAFLAGTNISYDPGYKRLAQAAYQRYEDGAGIEWLVASALNDPRGPQGVFGTPYSFLKRDVKNCKASPQEYAAVAIIARIRKKMASARECVGASSK